jgi:glycolate oxidase iron-sulfur subunit
MSHRMAARNIRAFVREADGRGAGCGRDQRRAGCGTTVKDYGHMFRTTIPLAADAARGGGHGAGRERGGGAARPARRREMGLRVAYHAACSLQHGQKITDRCRRSC